MRPKVVLYNPSAVFFTMPLGLVAVGSALDRTRYDVRIVDARLETDPAGALAAAAKDALCVGMGVLTGAPIRDAVAASRAVKQRSPATPVIWGGWHASLFPCATLQEPAIDVTVQGQGEHTFAELVDRLAAGAPLDGLPGIAHRDGDRPRQNPARSLVPLDELPTPDYRLLDVEGYFVRKGRRQIDMVSSAGCHFRCAFCADPFVFGRRWVGASPERVGAEMGALWERYHFDEVAFQDETFFTYRDRVGAIAEEILRRGLRVKWTATLRADQGVRLSDEVFALCVRSGLDRVMIGVESGDQATLDWMQKDITLDQVETCAAMCVRHGVGATFPFIVGFPQEPTASINASLRLAGRLRRMSPRFETPIFYFKPYPGSPITQQVVDAGYELPDGLDGWADFDFIGSPAPWVDATIASRVERFKFYNRMAGGPDRLLRRPLRWVSRWRCRHDVYGWPVEKAVIERLRPQPELS